MPISPPAHDGSTMFFLFADVATGFMIAYIAKAKYSFVSAFTKAINTFKRYGHEVKIFRSDAETVLKDGEMGQYLEFRGALCEHRSEGQGNSPPLAAIPQRQTLGLGIVPCHRLQEPDAE